MNTGTLTAACTAAWYWIRKPQSEEMPRTPNCSSSFAASTIGSAQVGSPASARSSVRPLTSL